MSNFNQVSYYTLNKSLKFILHCNNNKHQLINDLPCLDKPSFVFSLLKPRRKYKKWFIIILPVKLQCHYWLTIVILIFVYLYSCCFYWYTETIDTQSIPSVFSYYSLYYFIKITWSFRFDVLVFFFFFFVFF